MYANNGGSGQILPFGNGWKGAFEGKNGVGTLFADTKTFREGLYGGSRKG